MMPSVIHICRNVFKRLTVWTVIGCFSLSLIAPQAAYAQSAFLPQPGTLVHISPGFTPPIITGIQLSPSDPLHINFLIDIGDNAGDGSELSTESQKLINYFFAALTVPENEMWVNLSPYEKNKIIADPLSHTAMGRDMLAQDYLLKQLSASMMYPEEELGRKFWQRVHQKALQEFGTTDIPLNTFNKIWIIPQKAQVYVNGPNIFIADSHLKVMLEEDYLALKHHTALQNEDTPRDLVSGVSSAIVREILIPEIEREINTGQNFAPLRQIFHSLILATWYKKNLRNSLLGRVYVNQNKVDGIEITQQNVREDIYQQYLTALQKGVFDYIREDLDPTTHTPIPRRYFSGGVDMAQLSGETLTEGISDKLREAAATRKFHTVETYAGLREIVRDQALLLEKSEFQVFLETAFELARANGEPVRIFVNGEKILQYAASDNIETILPFARTLTQRQLNQDLTAESFTMFSAENEIYIDTHTVVIEAHSFDSDGAILAEIEERLEVQVGQFSLRPEREENEREAERRAAIEIRQRLGALHGEAEAIMALRRNITTEEQRRFISQREQQLLADMRRLYREMPVQIVGRKDYSFYSQALTDLKRHREKLSTLIRQADARGDKEKLARLNQEAIRSNRLLIKTQILIAGLLQSGLSRDGIRHPTPAMNALEGAINSASALEIELEYRIQRLRGRKFRRSLETQDWVGNRVRTFALGTFDIDIEKPNIGQNEPRVTVRQRRPVNVHTRLNRIRLMTNRGEIEAAVNQIDYLIGLYQVQYFRTLETYQFITDDLRELRKIVQGLTEGEDLPSGTLKDDIKTRVVALTGHIQTPKLMAWDDVRYRSRRKAFEGQIKKIASELSEYMVVLKNKTDLTYYAAKLRRAQQRQELGRKVTLSQRDRLMISERLA
ncbi:MAG: hypothetical protein K8I00_06345, partial [Candidatus Omnitrophica bacterium]|nr:hypothetical protein [Candidatus Omnitrophota bacterium]